MDRVILHSDLNNFYASVECMHNPEYRGKCVAVCGDEDMRHGIVLAKSTEAKAYGIKTGEVIWQAKQKCPDLIIVKPHFERYLQISRLVRAIYAEYTDQIEPFGIDEAWLDVTGSIRLFGGVENIVNGISNRVREELGVTVSIGVSFNKVFAKLGSDMKKPNGITYLPRETFREKIWGLPVEELLYVGRATTAKLHKYNIRTIGDLAQAPRDVLVGKFGKVGGMLHDYANGLDNSRVMNYGESTTVKSVGNSSTAPNDICTKEEASALIFVLSESVAARLRKYGLRAEGLAVTVKDNELMYFERQMRLPYATNISTVIAKNAIELFNAVYDFRLPVRMLGVRAISLTDSPVLEDMLEDTQQKEKQERLDIALDTIRERYGYDSITRGIVFSDDDTIDMNPTEVRTFFPTSGH